MHKDLKALVVIILISAVFILFDRYIGKRALRRNFKGQCAKCGVHIGTYGFPSIPVAGGLYSPIKARVCARCALRANNIWKRTSWALAVIFILTFVILWLKETT